MNVPEFCTAALCNQVSFDLYHAMPLTCKRGGNVSQRHDKLLRVLQDLLGKAMGDDGKPPAARSTKWRPMIQTRAWINETYRDLPPNERPKALEGRRPSRKRVDYD